LTRPANHKHGRIVSLGVLAGLWLVAATLVAAPAAAQSLDDALAMTYASNPTLLAERARLRAIDEGVPQALSGWRPTVTVNGAIRRQFTDTQTAFQFSAGEQTIYPKTFELSASQPLYRGGRTVAETKRAEALVQSGRADLIDVEQQVLLRAATAFYNVVRDQAVVGLNINNERVLTRQLEATRDRFEVGEVTRTDVSQAEARLADAAAARIESEGNLQIARTDFEAVVGVLPGKLSFPPAERMPGLFGAQAGLDLAMSRNPAILSAAFDERAALYDISAAGGRLLPEVTLDTSLGRAYDPNTFTDEQDSFQIGASVRVPLYQSGEEYSLVREYRQTAAQRRRELDQARRDTREDFARGWEQLITARARISSFQASVRANQIALDGVEQEAAVGARTVLDVLDAEQELFNARVNLVRARRDEGVAAFAMLEVTGGMTAAELRLPVASYDPAVHYNQVRDKWLGFGDDYEGGELFDLDTEGMFDFLE